jgi:hypothetical protein
MAKSMQCQPTYIPPEGETIIINTQLYNPENNPVTVWAIISGEDYGYTDSIQLYDDGQHHDSLVLDNFWGNSQWLSGLQEDVYAIAISSHDIKKDYIFNLPPELSFTTIGPIELNSYQITSVDSIPNPGDNLKFTLYLKNNGKTTTASDISLHATKLDSFITNIVAFSDPQYGDIASGEFQAVRKMILLR